MKKYTDVDIVAELQKLVDSHVDSYKEDFDIDKRIIRRAAESQNPEDKTLMCSAVRMERTASMKIRSSFRDKGSQHLPFLCGTDLRRVHCPRHCSENRQAWQGVRGHL